MGVEERKGLAQLRDQGRVLGTYSIAVSMLGKG